MIRTMREFARTLRSQPINKTSGEATLRSFRRCPFLKINHLATSCLAASYISPFCLRHRSIPIFSGFNTTTGALLHLFDDFSRWEVLPLDFDGHVQRLELPKWRWSTMDVDSSSPFSSLHRPSDISDASASSPLFAPLSSPACLPNQRPFQSWSRILRARPSDPLPPPMSTSKQSSRAGVNRKPSQKELNNIQRRLGAEGLKSRRDELAKEKERELKAVVEGHDGAVREKFHLEKFVSLLEGWDPEVSASVPATTSSKREEASG